MYLATFFLSEGTKEKVEEKSADDVMIERMEQLLGYAITKPTLLLPVHFLPSFLPSFVPSFLPSFDRDTKFSLNL